MFEFFSAHLTESWLRNELRATRQIPWLRVFVEGVVILDSILQVRPFSRSEVMKRIPPLAVGLALLAFAACANESGETANEGSDALAIDMRAMHETMREDLVRSAEMMPAEHFDFQPTLDVRTFGQIVGHVATTLYDYCAPAGVESNPNSGLIEQRVFGKEDLVNELKTAYDYCEEALASLDDVNGLDIVGVIGDSSRRPRPRLSFLAGEIQHTSLHYGNMVTYMRLNGVVPASTVRRGW